MTTNCPHCGQKLEGDDSLVGTTVECPGCGKSFTMTGTPGATPPLPEELPETNELDEANSFLERMIGNVAHAIFGIFRRAWEVLRYFFRSIWNAVHWMFDRLFELIRFFFSIRFAKFLVLLTILAALLAVLGGLVSGPFFLWLWLRRTKAVLHPGIPAEPPPGEIVEDDWGNTFISESAPSADGPTVVDSDPFWWVSHADDIVFSQAVIIETVWIVLIAGWGIVKGIESYKRGVIARWRARRREKRAARRAAKDAARNTKMEGR